MASNVFKMGSNFGRALRYYKTKEGEFRINEPAEPKVTWQLIGYIK
jgi:hypothetical protein